VILVTGAAGFIGSNIVATLNDRGRDDIVVCDRLDPDLSGSDGRGLNLRKRSFRDVVLPEDLPSFLAGRRDIAAVLHMGANASTLAADSEALRRDNFLFSRDLLDRCTAAGVPLVYASSAATYGDGAAGFEDGFDLARLRRLQPLNPYAWSKHLFDLAVAERLDRGLSLPPKCIGLKFFNVFGPNEYHKGAMRSVIARNFDTARAGGTVELFRSHRAGIADGGQKRDFVYVEDVVEIVLWALEQGPPAGLFNVGTGRATSFRELIEALFAAVAQPARIAYVPMPEALRERYQYFTEAPIVALRGAGCAVPFRPVGEAVRRYAGYLGSGDRYR
jgi:ADP-L-glycero-D-manno-heptose 6-epimerase